MVQGVDTVSQYTTSCRLQFFFRPASPCGLAPTVRFCAFMRLCMQVHWGCLPCFSLNAKSFCIITIWAHNPLLFGSRVSCLWHTALSTNTKPHRGWLPEPTLGAYCPCALTRSLSHPLFCFWLFISTMYSAFLVPVRFELPPPVPASLILGHKITVRGSGRNPERERGKVRSMGLCWGRRVASRCGVKLHGARGRSRAW